MQITILFETGEGQTAKITEFIASHLREAGHDVTVADASDTQSELALGKADKAILAAPVHERRHPKTFEAAVTAARQNLANRPTLMLSVSLMAAFPDGLADAQDYLTEMKMRTGFAPTQEALIAGAVRSGSYDYYQSQILRHVVLQGHEVELTDGVKEFTDWDALTKTVTTFLNS